MLCRIQVQRRYKVARLYVFEAVFKESEFQLPILKGYVENARVLTSWKTLQSLFADEMYDLVIVCMAGLCPHLSQ